jgi:hypothetical protein
MERTRILIEGHGKAMAKVAILADTGNQAPQACAAQDDDVLWKKRATALCPRCLLEVEDATHVWQCQDPRALNVWTQAIANLETWMQKQRTEPGIIRVICASSGLAKRIHRGDTSRNFYALPAVVQKQDAIGWQSFLEGRPSVGWSEVQHRYYEFLDSRRTGLR